MDRCSLLNEGAKLSTAHTNREKMAVQLRDAASMHNDPNQWPSYWEWHWAVASQWCSLSRTHAALLMKHSSVIEVCFDGTAVPDEHAFAVFFRGVLGAQRFGGEIMRRSPVMVIWGKSSNCPHSIYHSDPEMSPKTFHIRDLTLHLL